MKLTKEETKWLNDLQKVMDRCPSSRLSAYTVGDRYIEFYDNSKDSSIDRLMDDTNYDFAVAVDELNAAAFTLKLPFHVHSTAG